MSDLYLLMKRGLYYRPEAKGYTGVKADAGRYDRADAESHADQASGVSMVAEADAPEFAPSCFDDVARDRLAKERDDLRAALSGLQSRLSQAEADLAGAREAFDAIVKADIHHEGDSLDEPGHRYSRTWIGDLGIIAQRARKRIDESCPPSNLDRKGT